MDMYIPVARSLVWRRAFIYVALVTEIITLLGLAANKNAITGIPRRTMRKYTERGGMYVFMRSPGHLPAVCSWNARTEGGEG